REDPRVAAAHRPLAPRLERETPHSLALAAADEGARAAAGLAHQADRAERHLPIDRLAHVVERETGDRDRGERLHLDAGARRARPAPLPRAGWPASATSRPTRRGHAGPRGPVRAPAPTRARLKQPSPGSRHTL